MQSAKQKNEAGTPFPSEPFPGFGRQKLGDICNEFGLDIQTIITGLAKEKVTAEASQSIKEIASSVDMDPHAFFEVLHRVVIK